MENVRTYPQSFSFRCLCGASPASLELALGALVDEPMWSQVAHVAVPENESRVGFDHLEGVLALSGFGHLS